MTVAQCVDRFSREKHLILTPPSPPPPRLLRPGVCCTVHTRRGREKSCESLSCTHCTHKRTYHISLQRMGTLSAKKGGGMRMWNDNDFHFRFFFISLRDRSAGSRSHPPFLIQSIREILLHLFRLISREVSGRTPANPGRQTSWTMSSAQGTRINRFFFLPLPERPGGEAYYYHLQLMTRL